MATALSLLLIAGTLNVAAWEGPYLGLSEHLRPESDLVVSHRDSGGRVHYFASTGGSNDNSIFSEIYVQFGTESQLICAAAGWAAFGSKEQMDSAAGQLSNYYQAILGQNEFRPAEYDLAPFKHNSVLLETFFAMRLKVSWKENVQDNPFNIIEASIETYDFEDRGPDERYKIQVGVNTECN